MRSPRPTFRSLFPLAVVAALLVAGCSAYQAGWTFDPSIGVPTAAPSGAASSPAASSEGSLAPASGPPASGLVGSPAAGSPGASGTTALTLTAKNVTFDQHDLAAAAGTPFAIQFDNEDSGLPHNVAIYSDASTSKILFRGDVITGPAQTSYSVPALPAGTYYFQCDIHPAQMNGTIVVH